MKEKNKRQVTSREKIFTNHISDKGLIFRIYKEYSKLISNSQSNFKKAKDLKSFHRRNVDDRYAHENMLSIIS